MRYEYHLPIANGIHNAFQEMGDEGFDTFKQLLAGKKKLRPALLSLYWLIANGDSTTSKSKGCPNNKCMTHSKRWAMRHTLD